MYRSLLSFLIFGLSVAEIILDLKLKRWGDDFVDKMLNLIYYI